LCGKEGLLSSKGEKIMAQLYDVYLLESEMHVGGGTARRNKGSFVFRSSWSLVCQILAIKGLNPDKYAQGVLESGHVIVVSIALGGEGVAGTSFWIEPVENDDNSP
jgi:hypothetical protein